MSALVLTGATGFLGAAVVDLLDAAGRAGEVVALARRPVPELSRRGVEVRVGSLTDPRWVGAQVAPGARVIHLAGRVGFEGEDPRALYELHVEATRAVCHAALQAGSPRVVVVTSSGASAVSRQPRLHTERDGYAIEIVSRWPYYRSKMLQERLVLDLCGRAGLPAVVIAPSLLLGPGDARLSSTGVVDDYLHRRHSFVPSGGISVVDVRDTAAAVVAALEAGTVGARYFLGSLNCSFATFFGILERCSGVAPPALPAPRAAAVLGARLLGRLASPGRAAAISPAKAEMASHFWYVDASRAAAELGFRPRRPETTIRDTVAFIRARPTERAGPPATALTPS